MDKRKPDQRSNPAAIAAAATSQDLSLDEAEKLLNAGPAVEVLDVRTPAEFKDGHLSGARNIDVMDPDFMGQVSALARNKPYLVHCAMGSRSAKAVEAMQGLGFKTLYHMPDGMKGWLKAGKPVQK